MFSAALPGSFRMRAPAANAAAVASVADVFDRPVQALAGRRRRRAGRRFAHDAQHRPVGVLHAHEEVEPPLRLVEHVGDPVARLRDVVVVGPDRRAFGVGAQQRLGVAGRPARVLVEIAGVVPAAAQVALGGGVCLVVVEAAVLVLQRAREAGGVGPARARARRVLGLAGALVEEHAHGLLEDVPVHLVRDLERVRADVAIDVEHVVVAGRGDRREREPPRLVARRRVGRAAVPDGGRCHEDARAGGGVHEGVGRARGEGFARVEAGLRIADDRDLFEVGEVAELIDDDVLADRRRGAARASGAARGAAAGAARGAATATTARDPAGAAASGAAGGAGGARRRDGAAGPCRAPGSAAAGDPGITPAAARSTRGWAARPAARRARTTAAAGAASPESEHGCTKEQGSSRSTHDSMVSRPCRSCRQPYSATVPSPCGRSGDRGTSARPSPCRR